MAEDKEKLLSENEKLEKQQKKLQQELNKMVLSKEVMEQKDTIDRLQEKVTDLGRLERHLDKEQVQSSRTVKDIRTGREGK